MSVSTKRTSDPAMVLDIYKSDLTKHIDLLGNELDSLDLDKEVTQSPALEKHLDTIGVIYQWVLLENKDLQTLLSADQIIAERMEHIDKQISELHGNIATN